MELKLERINKKNICFTGMMGSGKSIIGRQFAKIVNYEFFDTDSLIEKKSGQTIEQIFNNRGEKYFREYEKNIISDILKRDNCIISLGGGSILSKSIRKLVKKNSFNIYLEVDIEVLYKRVSQSKKRPLLKNQNIRKKIEELQTSRNKYYKKADLILNNSYQQKTLLEELIKFFSNNE